MKPNELRIGNYIEHIDHGIFEVEIITSDGRIGLKDWEFLNIKYLKPVKLNQKLLIEFGFKKEQSNYNNYRSWYELFDDYILIRSNDIITKYRNFQFVYLVNYDFVKIKYTHRLQNLYFILTGKELKFKE